MAPTRWRRVMYNCQTQRAGRPGRQNENDNTTPLVAALSFECVTSVNDTQWLRGGRILHVLLLPSGGGGVLRAACELCGVVCPAAALLCGWWNCEQSFRQLLSVVCPRCPRVAGALATVSPSHRLHLSTHRRRHKCTLLPPHSYTLHALNLRHLVFLPAYRGLTWPTHQLILAYSPCSLSTVGPVSLIPRSPSTDRFPRLAQNGCLP